MSRLFESKGESNPFGALSIAINKLEARVEALEVKAGIRGADVAEPVAEPVAEAEAEAANEEAKPRRRTRKAE